MKSMSRGVGKKTTGKASKDIYAQPGDDFEAQQDFEALSRAHEVTSDKSRHKRAMEHGRKKLSEHAKKGEAMRAAMNQPRGVGGVSRGKGDGL